MQLWRINSKKLYFDFKRKQMELVISSVCSVQECMKYNVINRFFQLLLYFFTFSYIFILFLYEL